MCVQILSAAEDREKGVVALEEELARRRRDLEHDHSTRLTEAEATVRRLQVPAVLHLPTFSPQSCPHASPLIMPPRPAPNHFLAPSSLELSSVVTAACIS